MVQAHLSPIKGRVLQVWQRTAWLTFRLTDRRYRVGNHSNRGGSLWSHDDTCSSLAVGVDTCRQKQVNVSPQWPLITCSRLVSHLMKTRPHCRLHVCEHSFLLHRPRNLNTHELEGVERGMLGNILCAVITWLRSCSKELSPDLLTDPEPFPETLTRAGEHKALIVKTHCSKL